jgi:isocitrate dehydrogenase
LAKVVWLRVHNAWLKTIEDGVHTGDIFREGVSTKKVGTAEFGDAVVARLGQTPSTLKVVNYPEDAPRINMPKVRCIEDVRQDLVGIDIYMRWEESPKSLVEKLQKIADDFILEAIISRGVVVWPNAHAETGYVDHMRARFFKDAKGEAIVSAEDTIALLKRVADAGITIAKMEHLFLFDGQKGFSVGQGQ